MARSARLRLRDLRDIHRLVNECRELGDDPLAWRRHLLGGLVRALGAGIGTESEGRTGNGYAPDGIADWGWNGAADRRVWQALMAEYAVHGYEFNPAYRAYRAAVAAGRGICFGWPELLAEKEWRGSRYFQDYHRPAGGDHYLGCHLLLDGRRERAIVLVRAPGEADFGARDRAHLQEAYTAAAVLIGGPLAGYADPAPSALPPRTRQVLRCLLEGDSDKQVARRLRLATATINQHTKRIFAHFRVNSRTELLARWVRRGWPIGGWEPPGE